MSKKSNHEAEQRVIAIQSNHPMKEIYKQKHSHNINYGIVTNTIILISITFFIFFCYLIDSFLVNPLVIIGIILITTLFSIFNLLSILEKERENSYKNNKVQNKEEET